VNIYKNVNNNSGLPQISSSKHLQLNTNLHTSHLHSSNTSMNEDFDLSHIINTGSTKLKKVGRAAFGNVMTPPSNNIMHSTKNTYRSHISTPENYFKVTQ
jgi:hypothetical protein